MDTNVPLGGTVTFNVVASSGTTMTYQWYSNNVSLSGATQSSYTINNAQLAAQATYYVNVVNAGGTTTSSNAFLTVTGVAPTITVQPQNQAFNTNDAATLSVMAVGTMPLSYQWMLNSTSIPGATSSTLSYSHISTNNAGLYSVLVSNDSGVVTSSTAVVTVQAPPYILVQPQSQYVLLGVAATFSVTGMSKSAISYQWYYNGSKIAGATSSSYTVLSLLGLAGEGDYYVVLSNTNGSTTSAVAHLGYVSAAPSVLAQPVSEAVGVGQTASFSVTATNYPIAYQWRFNGSPLSGATNSTLTLYNVQTNNAGAYSVVLTNAAGSVTSSAATLTVNLPVSIATPPQSQTAIAGQSVTFGVLISGTGPFSYQWAFGGNAIAGATNSALAINNVQTNNAGTYAVRVENGWGPAATSSTTLAVIAPVTFVATPKTQGAIAGQIVNFGVVASGTGPLSYQWYCNGTALPGATSSTLSLGPVGKSNAGDYKVTVSNAAGSSSSPFATLTIITNPPTISTTGMTPGGFSLQTQVPTGRTYVVQASDDLVNWIPIYTNVAVSGTATFTDPSSVGKARQFYRVQYQ